MVSPSAAGEPRPSRPAGIRQGRPRRAARVRKIPQSDRPEVGRGCRRGVREGWHMEIGRPGPLSGDEQARTTSYRARVRFSLMIFGVMKISSSDFSCLVLSVRNRRPSSGRSPRKGTLFEESWLSVS